MNDLSRMPIALRAPSGRSRVAVLAMGGQGGGVLADWIVELAEAQGWVAQSTSVPGVAQRTGATVYYIEMLPPKGGRRAGPVADAGAGRGRHRARRRIDGGRPRHPARPGHARPHDADRLVAPRLCGGREGEARRRHRRSERRSIEAADVAAKRFIAFDMEALAEQARQRDLGLLFGALAASGALPFRARQLRGGHQVRRPRHRAEPERLRAPPTIRHATADGSAARSCRQTGQTLCAAAGLRRSPELDALVARIRAFPLAAA